MTQASFFLSLPNPLIHLIFKSLLLQKYSKSKMPGWQTFYALAEKKKHKDYNPTASVTTKKQNDKVLISVEDNGVRQADVFAIDSMPIEICKLSREQRNKMGKESGFIHQIKDTVHHKINIFMATNCIAFVLLPE